MTEATELVLRAAAVALALAAAAAVALRPGRASSRAWAAIAVAGIAAFGIASARGGIPVLGPAIFWVNAWCLATPVVVWLLARDVFADRPVPLAAALALLGAYSGLASAFDWGRSALGPAGEWPRSSGVAFDLLRLAELALLASSAWLAVREWRADLVEARRRARAGFVLGVSAVFMAFASSEFVFGPAGAPLEARIAGFAVLALLAFGVLQLAARGSLDEVLAEPVRRGPPELAVASEPVRLAPVSRGLEAALARRVVEAMQAGSLWKREGLTVAVLAAELGTQEYLLRRAINGQLGYRNFNDFLHDWRLKEAAERLASARARHLPVLSIALDCGYGSIGPFNRAFKARFGVTPTQYRHLRESGDSTADSGIGQHSR